MCYPIEDMKKDTNIIDINKLGKQANQAYDFANSFVSFVDLNNIVFNLENR